MKPTALPKVILLTVGTGDRKRLEESLLAPLRKSLRDGEWTRAILLPSQVTGEYAEMLKKSVADLPIEIIPLPEHNMENDVDRCYSHFERIIAGLLEQGCRHRDIVVDYTRGTKPMSAALALAAVRRDITNLRYMTGREKNSHGQVVAGTEEIYTGTTAYVTRRRQLDAAKRFFKSAHFSAAVEILPDPDNRLFEAAVPEALRGVLRAVHSWARFYAAWDRFDHLEAVRLAERMDNQVPETGWERFAPSSEMFRWVRRLAEPFPEKTEEKAARCRDLAAEILANGERRISGGQLEDACIRAYRVLELAGQARLFQHGYDSARLDPDDSVIKSVLKKRQKKNKSSFSSFKDKKNGKYFYMASREMVLSILKELEDPLQKRLSALAERPAMRAKKRNTSLLIHGYVPMAQADADDLREHYAELAELLIEDDRGAQERLRIARLPDFSSGAKG